jgi:hypothetical protein
MPLQIFEEFTVAEFKIGVIGCRRQNYQGEKASRESSTDPDKEPPLLPSGYERFS